MKQGLCNLVKSFEVQLKKDISGGINIHILPMEIKQIHLRLQTQNRL